VRKLLGDQKRALKDNERKGTPRINYLSPRRLEKKQSNLEGKNFKVGGGCNKQKKRGLAKDSPSLRAPNQSRKKKNVRVVLSATGARESAFGIGTGRNPN